MSTNLSLFLTRLPMLMVYVGAAMFCIIFWRRAPRGALFALLGIGMFIVGTLISLASTFYIMQNRGGTAASLGQIATIFGIISRIFHAGGMGLLVTGVFAGRWQPEPSGFEVTPVRPLQPFER